MGSLEQQARKFAALYPKRPPSRPTGTWDGLCGVLMIQFGGFLGGASTDQLARDARPFWRVDPGGAIETALVAASDSGLLDKRHTKAPVGAFHFWSVPGVPAGHVGMDLRGGGAMIFMASGFLTDEWGERGSHIGVNTWKGYTHNGPRGAAYLGWATNYSGGKVKLPGGEKRPAKNQRQVLPTAPVRRRRRPNIDGDNPGQHPPRKAGAIITPRGWVRGDSGRQPPGGGPWFVNRDGTYSHSSGFTDRGTHDLKDLNEP